MFKKAIKGAIVGGFAGAVVSIAKVMAAVTAPVSYPAINAANGYYLTSEFTNINPLVGLGTGFVFGCAMVPFAPLSVIEAPLCIPAGAIAGGIANCK